MTIIIDCKAEEKLIEVSLGNGSYCVCSGDTVMYECTVMGDCGGITVWMGDFFQCSSGRNMIELLHSDFTNRHRGNA